MLNNILLYFIIYSFLGWCLESIYKTILEKRFVNSGFLYGPLCPIYGFGAVIMIFGFGLLPKNIFIIFGASMILLTLWEYIVGVILEKLFKTKYWDYSNAKFNINGRVCLKNSLYWGILGVIFIFLIHPVVYNLIHILPSKAIFYLNIVLYISLLADVIITVNRILFIDEKIEEIYQIGDKIKEKINELKQSEGLEKVSVQNIIEKLNELKHEQFELKTKIYKQIIRLRDAFPTMHLPEKVSKFIEQKIDLKLKRNKKDKSEGE